MSRVEWTRREPGEIESLLAISLLREHPCGQRPRPAQGDHGIDICVPTDDGIVVFQVKAFTKSLTSSHKRQITKSWTRFCEYVAERNLKVKAWYVVRPLNATQAEVDWLAELTADADFECEWRGLDFCEGLVAKYPEVVDYYLFDGKERLQDIVQSLLVVAGWRGGTSSDPFRPSDAYPTLGELHKALNAFDPHYYYDFSVTTVRDGERPLTPTATPDLVAATIRVEAGQAITFLIYQRFEEATNERLLTGSFTVDAEPGSAAAAAWDDFIAYGIPIEELAVTGATLDLPGGLGMDRADDAFIRVGPASLDTAQPFVLTVDVTEPDGTVVASTDINMQAATTGLDGKGLATSGVEAGGVFSFALRLRLDTHLFRYNIRGNDLTGRRPADVLDGLDVLAAMEPGRQMQFRIKDGPPLQEPMGIPDDLTGQAQVRRLRRVCAALAEIQRHTYEPIRVPDLEAVTLNQAEAWVIAARLLVGETLVYRWKEPASATVDLDDLPAIGTELALPLEEPLTVVIDGRELVLGRKVVIARAARVVAVDSSTGLVEFEPGDDDTLEERIA